MKSEYCIYQGKLGFYILTGRVMLVYQSSEWLTFRDPTESEWATIDLIKARRINELELLVLTGISQETLTNRIKTAEEEVKSGKDKFSSTK